MENCNSTDERKVLEQKLADDDLINNAVSVARDIPIACEIIEETIEHLEEIRKQKGFLDGETECCLYHIRYIARSIERDTDDLHQSLIDTGHKDLLYR